MMKYDFKWGEQAVPRSQAQQLVVVLRAFNIQVYFVDERWQKCVLCVYFELSLLEEKCQYTHK